MLLRGRLSVVHMAPRARRCAWQVLWGNSPASCLATNLPVTCGTFLIPRVFCSHLARGMVSEG